MPFDGTSCPEAGVGATPPTLAEIVARATGDQESFHTCLAHDLYVAGLLPEDPARRDLRSPVTFYTRMADCLGVSFADALWLLGPLPIEEKRARFFGAR